MTAPHLRPVREALDNLREPPADDAAGAPAGGDERDGFGHPPSAMPDDCPVTPVGTEDGIFWFITALGELRGLTPDKVANKHIVGMFAPHAKYLYDAWPRKKEITVTDAQTGEQRKEWTVTGWRNDDVAMLLMDVAATRGVWNAREKVRGRGAWIGDDGGLILHCGDHVLIGGRWLKPGMHDALVYPTAPRIPKPTGSPRATAEQIAPNLTGELRARGIAIAADASPAQLLLELYKTWNWARPAIDPLLLFGWDGAAMLGGALDYRPLAWVTGGKATGKSALQKVKGWLFDGGILQSPDASEAAVRQVLGQQSLPVAIDEAEAEAEDRKILALVKLARLAATSQGNILRGGQDHKGHEFQATSCFLFSSILIPNLPPQDRSRIAVLELGELPAGAREPRFDKREVQAIGAWLRRRLVDRWHLWPETLERFTDALIDYGGQGGRAADQFGTLLAAAHLLLDDDLPDDDTLLAWGGRLSRDALLETSQLASDDALCVQHLATSPVRLDRGGVERPVSAWIAQAVRPIPPGTDDTIAGEIRDERKLADGMLQKIGLRVVAFEGSDYLAVASSHQSLARVFEQSDWKKGGWAQSLRRVGGALPNAQQRFAGHKQRCTMVPIEAFVQPEPDAERAISREEALMR